MLLSSVRTQWHRYYLGRHLDWQKFPSELRGQTGDVESMHVSSDRGSEASLPLLHLGINTLDKTLRGGKKIQEGPKLILSSAGENEG